MNCGWGNLTLRVFLSGFCCSKMDINIKSRWISMTFELHPHTHIPTRKQRDTNYVWQIQIIVWLMVDWAKCKNKIFLQPGDGLLILSFKILYIRKANTQFICLSITPFMWCIRWHLCTTREINIFGMGSKQKFISRLDFQKFKERCKIKKMDGLRKHWDASTK